jgi:mono/diheme cytochrome c family protein
MANHSHRFLSYTDLDLPRKAGLCIILASPFLIGRNDISDECDDPRGVAKGPWMTKSNRRAYLLLCLGWMGLVLIGCQKKATSEDQYKIPAEDASRKNPLGNAPDSIAKGKQVYDSMDCGVCHGKDGDGQGVVAKQMSVDSHIRNWHDSKSLQDLTDGELYYILVKGKRRMPSYEGLQSADQCWEMVSYIRSLAGQPLASNTK